MPEMLKPTETPEGTPFNLQLGMPAAGDGQGPDSVLGPSPLPALTDPVPDPRERPLPCLLQGSCASEGVRTRHPALGPAFTAPGAKPTPHPCGCSFFQNKQDRGHAGYICGNPAQKEKRTTEWDTKRVLFQGRRVPVGQSVSPGRGRPRGPSHTSTCYKSPRNNVRRDASHTPTCLSSVVLKRVRLCLWKNVRDAPSSSHHGPTRITSLIDFSLNLPKAPV